MFEFLLKFVYFVGGWLLEYFNIHHPPEINKLNIIDKGAVFELETKNKNKISCVMITPLGIGFSLDKNMKYIVYSHGNSSNIESHIDHMIKLSNNLNVVVIEYDYIGYGLSSNKLPNEARCYESLECVMDHVLYKMNINPKNVYLMGRSLGTGVVIDYAAKYGWTNPIVLFAPYKSIISTKYSSKWLQGFDKFVSIEKIPRVKCPVKIFHGFKDTTVPITHGQAIWKALENKSIQPTWFPDAKHCNIFEFIEPIDYHEILNYVAQ